MQTAELMATSIIQTCSACPTQYEIKLSDGRMMYFRYRWGYLSIRVSENPTEDISDAVNGKEIVGEDYGDEYDGCMNDTECGVHIGRAIYLLKTQPPCNTGTTPT